VVQGYNEGLIRKHIEKAQADFLGEHQLEEYVAGLDPAECVRILLASPEDLSYLAARRDECRVGPDEKRSFEEVIKAWTL
jgi:hypothetical protein